MRSPGLALLLTIAGSCAGCSDHSVDVGSPLALRLSEDGGTVLLAASCPGTSRPGLGRACIIDSRQKSYPVDGELPTLAAAPPYGTYLVLSNAFVPSDATTDGADAAIRVYAAPTNILSCPIVFPEGDEANRIAARVFVPEQGGLLVMVEHAVASPMQVVVDFDFQKLFKSGPKSLPFEASGYVARFYVGAVPPAVNPPPPTSGGAVGCVNTGS